MHDLGTPIAARAPRLALALALGAGLVAAGCTTADPSLGERLTADAEARSSLAAKATEGERLIARGEAQIERGQRRVRRGESEVSDGRALVEQGERLVREAERGARATTTAAAGA